MMRRCAACLSCAMKEGFDVKEWTLLEGHAGGLCARRQG